MNLKVARCKIDDTDATCQAPPVARLEPETSASSEFPAPFPRPPGSAAEGRGGGGKVSEAQVLDFQRVQVGRCMLQAFWKF